MPENTLSTAKRESDQRTAKFLMMAAVVSVAFWVAHSFAVRDLVLAVRQVLSKLAH